MANRAKKFRRHFSGISLDIRRMTEGGFYDQKVTPDLMTAVAGVICEAVPRDADFTVRDIWDSDEFERVASDVFTKTSPSDARARLEYDKFISQPLRVLNHAEILSGEKTGGKWKYRVANRGILNDVSIAEGAALDFLSEYIGKMLADSGLTGRLGDFFEKQNAESLQEFEDAFRRIALESRGINKLTIGRILPKIVNIPAFKARSRGRIRGRLSRGRITLLDIRYNRENWRDAQKAKEIPRAGISPDSAPIRAMAGSVMREVKEFHRRMPEVEDANSGEGGVEAHHIFPRSAYPELATVRENIILLTPAQHAAAHPKGTSSISKSYQLFCLTQKLDAVESCESDPDCNFYSMSDFVGMLAFCGVLDAKQKKLLRHDIEEPADNQTEKGKVIRRAADKLRRLLMRHYVGN